MIIANSIQIASNHTEFLDLLEIKRKNIDQCLGIHTQFWKDGTGRTFLFVFFGYQDFFVRFVMSRRTSGLLIVDRFDEVQNRAQEKNGELSSSTHGGGGGDAFPWSHGGGVLFPWNHRDEIEELSRALEEIRSEDGFSLPE